MIQLNEASSTATQEIFTLIAALGTGGLFIVRNALSYGISVRVGVLIRVLMNFPGKPPLMAIHAAMPISDMATSTSTCESNVLRGSAVKAIRFA